MTLSLILRSFLDDDRQIWSHILCTPFLSLGELTILWFFEQFSLLSKSLSNSVNSDIWASTYLPYVHTLSHVFSKFSSYSLVIGKSAQLMTCSELAANLPMAIIHGLFENVRVQLEDWSYIIAMNTWDNSLNVLRKFVERGGE